MIEQGQQLSYRQLEDGTWACSNNQGDIVQIFFLEESARLEVSIWNQWLALDDQPEDLTQEQWDEFGLLGNKIDVWEGIVEIMRERGMKI